jgi:DNA-damage-inducible protein J
MTTAADTTMVHVRMHKGVKTKAEKALKAMGLSVSDAVRVLLTRVATEQALPFDVRVPNVKTRAAMKELESGRGVHVETVAGLMADLNADD